MRAHFSQTFNSTFSLSSQLLLFASCCHVSTPIETMPSSWAAFPSGSGSRRSVPNDATYGTGTELSQHKANAHTVSDDVSRPADSSLRYTQNDSLDMQRLGKPPQLRRSFRQISAISLICVLVSTWEVLFLANDQGLADGGLAGLFWSYLWTLVGFALIAASLAEMSSMAPTSGGMYHVSMGVLNLCLMGGWRVRGRAADRGLNLVGIRVRTSSVPEVHELHNGMDVDSVVAGEGSLFSLSRFRPRSDSSSRPVMHQEPSSPVLSYKLS